MRVIHFVQAMSGCRHSELVSGGNGNSNEPWVIHYSTTHTCVEVTIAGNKTSISSR